MTMSDPRTIVLVAGYQDIDAADGDFVALADAVAAKDVGTEGVILVSKRTDGEIVLTDTGDHLGRQGAIWGAAAGLLIGLVNPLMLGSVVVGAGAGAVAGKYVDQQLKGVLHDQVGNSLPSGSSVIIGVFPTADQLGVERHLSGAQMKSVVPSGKRSLLALKDALADAMSKFNPDRTKLPIDNPPFGGVIGQQLADSVSDWSILATPKPPKGAPNVMLVLIDDAGFGNPTTYGGPIQTDTMTRVAETGLTYNKFHVTALCSPTRASLLTGRNHHRVGFGSIGEFPGPFPGYTAARPKSCAPVVRTLQGNGYVTGGFGKWHMSPDYVQGGAGPFDLWPNAWGFDHWWGFLGGASGQYDPLMSQDNAIIGVPTREDGEQYYLPDDITDKSVEWLHSVRAQDPDKPWFMYYSTGCSHAPHHVMKEWSDKYKGKFDEGWDVMREQVFARQKELGVIPPDTELTERPDAFPAWDSLTDNDRKLYARQMEVYAGYSENADWNVGRLIDSVEEMGELDNTLIIYIWGDNGASMEGTLTGSFNELTFLNGMILDTEDTLKLIEGEYGGLDAWGNPDTAPHYAAAWGWAGNTPFQWGKQMASHLGGTRNPMVVSWPEGIKERGLCEQFTHCIDVGPTILEAAGIPEAVEVDGIDQEPMDGTSFRYTFEDPGADEEHTEQYFEIYGSRALYSDGWWACSRVDKIPWDLSPETMERFKPGNYHDEDSTWELYYLPDDFSQARDLAQDMPEKLEELKKRWWEVAADNKVLPLLGGFSTFFGDLPPMNTQTRQTFYGDVQNISSGMLPRIYGRSYSIEADLEIPKQGAEGVLVAEADEIGGFALWVDSDRKLRHTYSTLGVKQYKHVSDKKLPTGDVTVKMQFDADEVKPGTAGDVSLWANDELIGSGRIDRTVPMRFSSYSGMDVGRDNGLVVDKAYRDKAPYPFTGTVRKVVFDLKPAPYEDLKKIHHKHSQHGVAGGIAG
jgi:arylsulfatase A-like enzyme/uncharacterized membrane protein